MSESTFDEALAACVTTLGEPTHRRFLGAKHSAAWVYGRSGMGPSKGLALQQDGASLRLIGTWFPATFARTLAGEASPNAPWATLSDAIAQAAAWLEAHR